MFCVFGKSKQLAKKKVHKEMLKFASDFSEQLRTIGRKTQEEKQKVVDDWIEKEFETMNPKKCTHEFSTPEFVKHCFKIMKLDNSNFADLTMMKKQYKILGVTHSKKTGKRILEWVTL